MNSTDGEEVKQVNYPADLVFGAACAAQRINGEYLKTTKWPDTSSDTRTPNRTIMFNLLESKCALTGDYISDDDLSQGQAMRKYFQGLTFKIIQGLNLSEFDRQSLELSSKDFLGTNFEVAVIASMPASWARGVVRDKANNRAKFATGGYVGRVGDKVTVTGEVLRCVYSQQWNCHYATIITDDDQALFFSIKVQLPVGSKVNLTGTVKKQADNSTQLNRVKIINL